MEEAEIKSLIKLGYYGAKSNYELKEIFADCKQLNDGIRGNSE